VHHMPILNYCLWEESHGSVNFQGGIIIGTATGFTTCGDIAQLVERTDRTREARGSNPLISRNVKRGKTTIESVPGFA
jgi:hypothetical protein